MKVELEIGISFRSPLYIVLDGQAAAHPPVFTFQSGAVRARGENMAATMQVGSYATVSVEWKDKGGNVVRVDGPTKWESSNPGVCQIEGAAGNPQIANLYAPGGIGVVKVNATADADLGEGVKAVTATLDVEVISGEAVAGEIKFTQAPAQAPQAAKK